MKFGSGFNGQDECAYELTNWMKYGGAQGLLNQNCIVLKYNLHAPLALYANKIFTAK